MKIPSLISKHQQQKGFTLVEVLVALGIFAVLASGYLIVAADTARGLSRLQEKTLAQWMAEDAFTRARTYESSSSNRFKSQRVEFAGVEWQLKFKTEKTDVSSMNRVTVSVAMASDTDNSIASLEAYFSDGTFVPDTRGVNAVR